MTTTCTSGSSARSTTTTPAAASRRTSARRGAPTATSPSAAAANRFRPRRAPPLEDRVGLGPLDGGLLGDERGHAAGLGDGLEAVLDDGALEGRRARRHPEQRLAQALALGHVEPGIR